MINVLRVLVFLIFLAICSEAHSFDVDGFRSGMNRKEVKNMLLKMNFAKIIEEATEITALGDYPLNQNSRFYSFGFCDEKLTRLVKSVKGSMKNFITLFEKFSGSYGKLKDSYAKTQVESFGEIKSISFIWAVASEKVTLNYSIVPKSEGINLIYETNKKCSQ